MGRVRGRTYARVQGDPSNQPRENAEWQVKLSYSTPTSSSALYSASASGLLESYAESVAFFLPETAYLEAEDHLSELVVKRGGDPAKALALLRSLANLGNVIGVDIYGGYESEARKRLDARDPEDWPILAAALALGCPIWTEDTDFFGCGVAIWTSNNIDMFLAE